MYFVYYISFDRIFIRLLGSMKKKKKKKKLKNIYVLNACITTYYPK